MEISGVHVYDRYNMLSDAVSKLNTSMVVLAFQLRPDHSTQLATHQPWPLFEPSVEESHVYYDQQIAQDSCLLRYR